MAVADKKSGFDTPAVVLIGLAALLFVYAFALFMQGGFLKAQDIERQAKQEAAAVTVDPGVAVQQDRLNEGYRWIDREQGAVGMSIEDAKARLVSKEAAADE